MILTELFHLVISVSITEIRKKRTDEEDDEEKEIEIL